MPSTPTNERLLLSFQTLYKAKNRHQKLLSQSPGVPGPSKMIVVEGPSGNHEESQPNGISKGTLSPCPASPSAHLENRKASKSFLSGIGRRSSPAGLRNQKNPTSRRSDRTTKMLLAVLALFLITEFPQGIMAFLSGLYGQEFFRKCYNSFAEVWDILALINSAINFILYCFMSKQFRTQFRTVFKVGRCFESKWSQVPTCGTSRKAGGPRSTTAL